MNNKLSTTMFQSPRIATFVLAVLVAAITVTFLSFVPKVDATMLFVAGVTSFVSTLFIGFYGIEYLVFRQINEVYKTLDQLKTADFKISRKKVDYDANPIKKLKDEVFVYVTNKQKEIEELKRLESFRREFLADVSHELKTPIFAAQGFVHTLLDGAKDDPAVLEKFLQKAARSLDGLDALVHDLVSVSQIESGVYKMQPQAIDISLLVLDVFETLEIKAQTRAISLHLKNKGLKNNALADYQGLTQVITNLIENGIKYGRESGRIVVKLEQEKKHIAVSVTDDGPGIKPEHLPRIFERFYRIDKSRSRDTGGTGLGLAIVKHILNAHQTKITVTSKVGEGCTFSFKLAIA
jgi:two-component system, OmpR family, phosphate regulon sensor histidine kinase PhoR